MQSTTRRARKKDASAAAATAALPAVAMPADGIISPAFRALLNAYEEAHGVYWEHLRTRHPDHVVDPLGNADWEAYQTLMQTPVNSLAELVEKARLLRDKSLDKYDSITTWEGLAIVEDIERLAGRALS